ncbi:Deoxyguanosinetriphosphate triphosphohydrolase-like protein, partial [Bienertia sinuspersici]
SEIVFLHKMGSGVAAQLQKESVDYTSLFDEVYIILKLIIFSI